MLQLKTMRRESIFGFRTMYFWIGMTLLCNETLLFTDKLCLCPFSHECRTRGSRFCEFQNIQESRPPVLPHINLCTSVTILLLRRTCEPTKIDSKAILIKCSFTPSTLPCSKHFESTLCLCAFDNALGEIIMDLVRIVLVATMVMPHLNIPLRFA